MKRLLSTFAIASSCLLLWAGEPTGREIMEREKANQELKDEDRMIEMQLIDRRGKVKTRSVHMLNMTTSENLERLMLVFLEPRDVKGTGLLTWEQADRDDDQWLYLPSSKKQKRITSGSKKSRFMGTDFAYEDLSIEKLDRHQYTLLESKKLSDQDCYLVEAVVKDPGELKNSGYSRRVLWVRKDINFTIRIEYYDKKGKLVKRLDNEEPVNIQGKVWRSNTITMDNLKANHKTKMIIKERKINQGLSEDSFSIRELKNY